MTRSIRKRALASCAVAGVAAAVLPWGTSASADEEPGYSGFVSTATATAVQIDIYEPTIPIPSSPQMEIHFAYSKAQGDSGSTKGRASWMWPGDPVGEGLKVIVEQAGLPPALGQAGYPMQVNSAFPAGPEHDTDEPTPGAIMRTSSSDGKATAETGFSGDGQEQDPDEGTGADTSGVTALQQFGQIITGQQVTAEDDSADDTADAPPPVPAVPDPLSVLVDFAGYESASKLVNGGDAVTATSRAAVGDLRLLGGLITMSGVDARSVATSDGAKGNGSGVASYGTMTIAGSKFRFGPDGFEAAGAPAPIPGLPDNPVKALETLGIKVTFPKPTYEVDGDKATSTVAALELQFDTGPLTKLLHTSALNDVLGPIAQKFPDSAGPLKSLLTSLGNLAPRFVVTLANARTSVDTVQGIDIPTGGTPTPPTTGGGSSTGSTGGSGGAPAPATDVPPAVSPPTSAPATETPDLVSSSPGLPKLFSFPGMLMVGGIAGAAFVGSYVRKLGLLALGSGAACPHGLESGLPDLRKVT